MSVKKLIFPCLFVLFATSLQAQFTISGLVLDSATREPLSPASVFCQNTTLGTTTNKQGEFAIHLKSGGYDLIFSFTGYQTQTIRVSEDKRVEVLLVKEDKSMGEVIIKSSNEVPDGWQKYGDFFLEHFIGSTPNAAKTSIVNPDVLKFYYYKKSNKLKVLATDAIQISNQALGYNMRYQLDSFVYYYGTDINLYRGYCLFSEMEGNDTLQAGWKQARAKTYETSKLRFMRSYYDSTVTEDGWEIGLLNETNNKKFDKLADPYDTTYYGAMDSTLQVEIWFPRKISITYLKSRPEPEYLRKMNLPKTAPFPISYIDMKDGIAITENGYYYDQKDWVNQGYWSWKNLADILPYDYLPER